MALCPKLAAQHHCLQAHANYCVPACTHMVLSARGASQGDQDTLARNWQGSGRGFALEDAAVALQTETMQYDASAPNFPDFARSVLDGQHWIITQVFSKGLEEHYDAFPPPTRGPYGGLEREWGRLHAVVLVQAAGTRFFYLDPFHLAAGQPLSIEATVLFGSVLQGACCICPI